MSRNVSLSDPPSSVSNPVNVIVALPPLYECVVAPMVHMLTSSSPWNVSPAPELAVMNSICEAVNETVFAPSPTVLIPAAADRFTVTGVIADRSSLSPPTLPESLTMSAPNVPVNW